MDFYSIFLDYFKKCVKDNSPIMLDTINEIAKGNENSAISALEEFHKKGFVVFKLKLTAFQPGTRLENFESITLTEKGLNEIKQLISESTNNNSFKLLNINLDNFKNLKNIKIDCSNFNNFLLVIGNNASGKSNILETISAIFTEVYTRKRIPNFKYELTYQIDDKEITIVRTNDSPSYKLNGNFCTKQKIIKEDLLPSKIIALYSGEETRLWEEYYEKFYFQYLRDLTSDTYDTFGRKMLYINKYYWNIALLILMISQSKEHTNFIKNKLKIDMNTVNIKIDFNIEFLKNNKSKELKGFVHEINPNSEDTKTYTLEELKTIITPEYDSEHQRYIEKYSLEQIFEILLYASLPKYKRAFNNIEILFNNGLSIRSLSEGEKKYILIYTVVDILADEKTLILMDEPDAHIHESGKEIICNLFEKYCSEYNRQIIITTHSPTLAHCSDDNHILMLENNSGVSSIIDDNRIDKIKKLTGGIWTATQQNIFLNSNNTLILFEGIGDIKYLKTALKIFKKDFSNLNNIDFLPFGGAQNACDYIAELQEIANYSKKIIVIFDRDDEGQKGMKKCLPDGKFEQGRLNTDTYLYNNIIYLMLPKTTKHNDNDFLIEDYFSTDLKKKIAQDKIDEANGIFNLYSKDLKGYIKKELSKKEYHTIDNMQGFKVLLAKIQNIIKDKETLKQV